MSNSHGRGLDDIGKSYGIDQSSDGHDYLNTYEFILNDLGPEPRIVIIGATKPTHFANSLAKYLPKARITAFMPTDVDEGISPHENVNTVIVHTLQEIHPHLSGNGPVDLIIEDGRNTRAQKREALANFIYYLRAGGFYIIEDLHAIHLEQLGGGDRPNVLDDLVEAHADSLRPNFQPRDNVLATAVDEIRLMGKLAIIKKRGTHGWKMRDADVLDSGSRVQTIRTCPPREHISTAIVASNNSALEAQRLQANYLYPSVSLREYTNVVAIPGQVYVQGSTVLADSFRFFTRGNPHNRNLKSISNRIAVLPTETPDSLSGTFYALDNEYGAHFGHVTGEVLSRLWGWEEAKRHYPDLKALISTNDGGPLDAWHQEYLAASGVPLADVVTHSHPVRLERLIAATPMYSQPAGIHPDLKHGWEAIGKRLSRGAKGETPKKIFIGRKEGATQRVCLNGKQVEEAFKAAGYSVIYPEDLSISDQILHFRNALYIAGYGGSGMFNLMFSGGAKNVTVITSESYDAVNEFLISSIIGGNITYFWCPAEHDHPNGGWSERAFKSDFSFDFARDGEMLSQVLDQD